MYQRPDWATEKRAALERGHVMTAASPPNVVTLVRGAESDASIQESQLLVACCVDVILSEVRRVVSCQRCYGTAGDCEDDDYCGYESLHGWPLVGAWPEWLQSTATVGVLAKNEREGIHRLARFEPRSIAPQVLNRRGPVPVTAMMVMGLMISCVWPSTAIWAIVALHQAGLALPDPVWMELSCQGVSRHFCLPCHSSVIVEAVGKWATLLCCPHFHSPRAYWPRELRSLRKRKNFRQVEPKERC
jgi:hypothetical protein